MQQFFGFLIEHWQLTGLAILLLIGLFILDARERGTGGSSLNAQDAAVMINRKHMLVIDLRDNTDYKSGHITGAKNYQLSELTADSNKLPKNKDKPVLCYGSTQQQAKKAVDALKKAGFKEVFMLAGGLQAWQKDNLPLIKRDLEVSNA
jgi:rhodanese-related sulfurtransferase